AAGKSIFNVVVEDDNTAVKYINYLKENRIGSATFLPINKIRAKYTLDSSVLNKKGVVDYALNLIQYDKKYENIFHLVFGDTLVIESIEDAKTIGIGNYRMVTLQGDIVAKSGAMSGGFNARKRSLGAFKNEELTDQLAKLDSKILTLKSAIDQLKENKETDERKIYDARQEKIEIEGDLTKLEKLLEIEGKDTDSIKREMEAITGDKTVIENSLKKIDREIKELDENISKLQEKKSKLKANTNAQGDVMDSLSKLEEKRDKIREKLIEIQSQIDTKKIQITNVLNPENQKSEKIIKESQESELKYKESLENINKEIQEKETQLKIDKEKEKELSKDYKKYIDQRDKLKEDKKKLEDKYNTEFQKFDKIKEKSTTLRYAISEFETLNKTLDEELELLYENLKAEFTNHDEEGNETIEHEKINELIDSVDSKLKETQIDVKELQNKVNNLKTKINSFGSINMKAVQVYDKLNEEFNELLEKRETLTSDQQEILDFVAEMEQKKKERFMETYAKLKQNFVKFYSMLSTKGEADLEIEDEEDLFNSGVEIKVRLSQKNFLDIKSLSGGEKTITAVAFIFAVQEFSPASFYIFDEIDAALDILNSEKLGKLIKASAHKAQYIVVSHSEYLIQSADVIYGVTMDKNKISGMVSLDLRTMKDYVESPDSK
ncbi:MAG: hypothetical protein ACOCXG_05145, partial [Nanoarchaeota archaeon]